MHACAGHLAPKTAWTLIPDEGIEVRQWKGQQQLEPEEASIVLITPIGLDRAKHVFQVRGVNDHVKTVLRK